LLHSDGHDSRDKLPAAPSACGKAEPHDPKRRSNQFKIYPYHWARYHPPGNKLPAVLPRIADSRQVLLPLQWDYAIILG